MTTLIICATVVVIILLGPRPRLDPRAPKSRVPTGLAGAALSDWLAEQESAVPNLTPGAEATIAWYDPDKPARTDLVFVYLHGFSATRQETAPITEAVARQLGGNVVQARLAGHGTGPDGMLAPAEDWLQSVIDTWDIATRLGERVVIIATSTGATLATWLAFQPLANRSQLHALLFMSPNFKVRTPIAWLLTAPWARQLIPRLIPYREWEPENEAAARYWTWRYSSHALIEMQKTVDWVARQPLEDLDVPMATMVMANDPTIDPAAAHAAVARWGTGVAGASPAELIPVTIEPDEPAHVFAGDITGAQRTAWCVTEFTRFLQALEAPGEKHAEDPIR